ncbi:MAG: hypothetical protein ACK4J0_02220 [Candidatus Anstonellaceae archaeon]
MGSIVESIKKFLSEPFNFYLVGILILLVIGVYFFGIGESEIKEQTDAVLEINYFYLPTCPHCAQQRPIINELSKELKNVSIKIHDASTPEGMKIFYKFATEAGLDTNSLAVPTTFIGKKAFIGFQSKETFLKEIEQYLEKNNDYEKKNTEQKITNLTEIDVPFFGKMDLTKSPLLVLAITLGLVDGFNPCAMWVLVYMIGLLMEVNDKRKFWLIIGSFLFASGALYFLFMTAWLNAFLLIGYIRVVIILIGAFALGVGILNLKDYFTKKELVCEVGDEEDHKKTSQNIKAVISQPLTIGIIISIVILAFVVNSIEFACSSAIPAVFTQVLALKNISDLERYLYIFIYDVFYMIDDMIMFVMAGFAVIGGLGTKYAKYCKLIGGILMTILGSIMLFAPGLLR